ncbi:MAG: FIG006285: ICC-like protein phosphoesterase [uncultured Solirubrobacterales bacterium]|uniref:FIG006285: ICC-like protein phosphoesterase n=1 Tax=uncultured Solirubrobacterales bacterium TaxID=768556 RepID=A0A6J4SIJ1_9ACTN|nr:MAG: FIG006285: ICC-like protein phosphoesterase [uncultured Solirubrobacterales bacterium]
MLALLYDIHGNLPALEAVLADAERAGAEGYLLGGDLTLFGAWPLETLERLDALADARWIRGNGERWTAAPSEAPDSGLVQGAIRDCAEALGAQRVTELAELPEQALVDGTRFCHGSPVSDVRSFFPTPGEDEQELLAGVREARLVFGHTHLAFKRSAVVDGREVELVNPGSVGMPFDGDPRAAYALLAPDDDRVEHRRVEYDHSAAAVAVRERFGGWAETVARRVEAARADVD